MNHLIIPIIMVLNGCTIMNRPMSALNMRTAIDECRELKLAVMVYQRPDKSVIAIRCIPRADEAEETVTLRPKIPVQILKPMMFEPVEIQNQ